MKDYITKVVWTEREVDLIISKMAEDIKALGFSAEDVIIMVCKGAPVFAFELCNSLPVSSSTQVFFSFIRSYERGTIQQKKGEWRTFHDFKDIYLKDKKIWIIDDVYETGNTLVNIIDSIDRWKHGPIKICVLVNKAGSKCNADIVGIDYEGKNFLIGRGMDYNELYRFDRHISEIIFKENQDDPNKNIRN